jgi:adenosylmethionine-8-amino-7-oxononanoate aminotransferase
LLNILPGPFSRIFYSDNGSTAVEVAIKMAIQYWQNKNDNNLPAKRNKVLAFRHSYHGDTFGAMSVSSRSVFTRAFDSYLFEVEFIDPPSPDNILELKARLENHIREYCCFIFEPLLQGAGGMKLIDASSLDELLAFARERDLICIADEVLTGFGRTGQLFACSSLKNKPDIVCLSKGLTGGTLALGVTAATERIYEAFLSDDRSKTFFHGHSFTANPIACAAALASMDLLLQEECLQRIRYISDQNARWIQALEAHRPAAIQNPRSLGTLLAYELASGQDGYLNTVSARVTEKAIKNGIYLRPLGNTVYILPPYCIDPEQLRELHEFLIRIPLEIN